MAGPGSDKGHPGREAAAHVPGCAVATGTGPAVEGIVDSAGTLAVLKEATCTYPAGPCLKACALACHKGDSTQADTGAGIMARKPAHA